MKNHQFTLDNVFRAWEGRWHFEIYFTLESSKVHLPQPQENWQDQGETWGAFFLMVLMLERHLYHLFYQVNALYLLKNPPFFVLKAIAAGQHVGLMVFFMKHEWMCPVHFPQHRGKVILHSFVAAAFTLGCMIPGKVEGQKPKGMGRSRI